jgi:hypothetical protein
VLPTVVEVEPEVVVDVKGEEVEDDEELPEEEELEDEAIDGEDDDDEVAVLVDCAVDVVLVVDVLDFDKVRAKPPTTIMTITITTIPIVAVRESAPFIETLFLDKFIVDAVLQNSRLF